jgi:excisionase family DNA binding protein
MQNRSWLTLEELSEYLSFSKEKIYILLRDHRIPAVKIGRHWRFNRRQIDEWMFSVGNVIRKEINNKIVYSKY